MEHTRRTKKFLVEINELDFKGLIGTNPKASDEELLKEVIEDAGMGMEVKITKIKPEKDNEERR